MTISLTTHLPRQRRPERVVQQSYDRIISVALLRALTGPLASVGSWRLDDLGMRDLQLRREPKGVRSWASLYVGLTSVLNIEENGRSKFRLTAAKTHREAGGFVEGWGTWQSLTTLEASWREVEGYLERVVPLVNDRWTDSEGHVHALLANSTTLGAAIVNREASHSFRNKRVRAERRELWSSPLAGALGSVEPPGPWWSATTRIAFGSSPDFIAVDDDGRLLVIEAKPANATGGIAVAPAQVACYALMYRQWLTEQPDACAIIEAELAQRQQLGLLPDGARTTLVHPVRVVPVLAVGPGHVSPQVWPRLATVARALTGAPCPDVEPLVVWVLDADGTPTSWAWDQVTSEPPASSPEAVDRLTYRQRARRAAQSWKEEVLHVEEDGRYPTTSDSTYAYVLPAASAARNLLTGVEGATALFLQEGLPWHRSVDSGPTNHLLSSQVQCVNALYRASLDPARLQRAFGDRLDIHEVLPMPDGRYVAFEYVGPGDLLNEGAGPARTRIDAAFTYTTRTGGREMALVEWKYTESYGAVGLGGNGSARRARYGNLWRDATGPLRSLEAGDGDLSLDDVLVEPLYQLVRQQLLARQLEQAGVADVVRVLHVGPSGNSAYQSSLPRQVLRDQGSSVADVWSTILRPGYTTRFLWLDSSRFLVPDITCPAYCARYGHS